MASGFINPLEPARSAAIVPRGTAFAVSGITGTMAAALAQDSIIYTLRCAPSTNTLRCFVEHVRLKWTTITAFTTPVTSGRRIGLYRASTAPATDGTALTPVFKDSGDAAASAAAISSVRIATTAALTAAGLVREANTFHLVTLSHVGAAGGYVESIFEAHASWNCPLELLPGELLVVSNPVAMDAAGTFNLAVDVHGHVAPAYGA